MKLSFEMSVFRARRWQAGCSYGAVWGRPIGLLSLVLLLACAQAPLDGETPVEAERFYPAEARVLLETAEDLLLSQGYVFEENELDLGILVGQQIEQVSRGRGSTIKGTIIRTQVVVEASAEGAGTAVLASFNISIERPTGERRTLTSETPQARRLRRDFYTELEAQLGIDIATSGRLR